VDESRGDYAGQGRLEDFRNENVMIYRRFGYLQSRLLVHKQDELRALEEQLDEFESREPSVLSRQQMDEKGLLLKRIEATFAAYGRSKPAVFTEPTNFIAAELLSSAQMLMSFNKPNPYRSVMKWFADRERASPEVSDGIKYSCYEPEISGTLAGRDKSCLPDTGATDNFVRMDYLNSRGIASRPCESHHVRLPNGKRGTTIGTVNLPFAFRGESEVHTPDFYVLVRCAKDVIVGSRFLRFTQTFERFGHRVLRKLQSVSRRRLCFLAGSERITGTLNGVEVDALPDTGSQAMVVSAAYASKHGLMMKKDVQHQEWFALADGSLVRALGIVEGMDWGYGRGDGETFCCDFLHETQAFTKQSQWFHATDDPIDQEDCLWAGLCTILWASKRQQQIAALLRGNNSRSQSSSPNVITIEEIEAESNRLLGSLDNLEQDSQDRSTVTRTRRFLQQRQSELTRLTEASDRKVRDLLNSRSVSTDRLSRQGISDGQRDQAQREYDFWDHQLRLVSQVIPSQA
jgi:hypothetical protein